ncbi:MAG: cadmium-translocating P-type ATPase [Verrucomicrobia bacterium]|nr:cadmium-translocating P-type ATPase [Verrucomicrobiota bacterium]
MSEPVYFDEFFASGKEETISPFLTPTSRKWGKNLSLRSSYLSAGLLAIAFVFSFTSLPTSFLFLIGVYFLSGTPALLNAIHDLRGFEVNIDVLMTLAALLSVAIGSPLEGGLLLVLFELSASMENAVSQKTKSALLSLRRISPRMARIALDDGTLYECAIREIPVGAKILVKAGEIIPLDGVVTAGSAFVNLVHLTGEAQPLSKKAGDAVPAGGLNVDGTLTIEVARTSGDSTLARIIQMITQASEAKPQVQQFLDKFGKYYASSIIALATILAFTLPWLLSIPALGPEGGVYRALTFLIAASPCALIIATPTAYLSAISSCARKGILLKGGRVFDAVSHCKTVAFDKTGTLTTGELTCTGVTQLAGPPVDTQKAIAIAATLERSAVHPIAKALVAFGEKLPLLPVEQFKASAGFGLEGVIDNMPVVIGHREFILSKKNLTIPPSPGLSAYLLVGDALFLFTFTDKMRTESKDVIAGLKKRDLSVAMLTGDHKVSAETVAKSIEIDAVFADLRPEDKLDIVAKLSQEQGLMMIGDGINDAPALARASVGIAMGKIGSSTAVEAADVVFLNDDLSLLGQLYDKSHQTRRIVKQNLTLALAVIVCATTPATLGWIPLWLAVILHEGGTVLVGLNSLRLFK